MTALPDIEGHFKEFKKHFLALLANIQEANLPIELGKIAAIFHDTRLKLESNAEFVKDDIQRLLEGCEELVRILNECEESVSRQEIETVYKPMKYMLIKLVNYMRLFEDYGTLFSHVRNLTITI